MAAELRHAADGRLNVSSLAAKNGGNPPAIPVAGRVSSNSLNEKTPEHFARKGPPAIVATGR